MPVYAYFAIAAAVFSFIGIIISLICLFRVGKISEQFEAEVKPKLSVNERIDTRLVNIISHEDIRKSNKVAPEDNGPISRSGICIILENIKSGASKERLISDELVIGRGHGCEINTEDYYVSGRHCRIILNGTKLFIEDMGSTNGTFLNGNKVTQRQEIRDNDTISMGNTGYLLHIRY